MKKLVLLAGVLALAAGCQKTELPEAPKNEQKGGLTIEASLGDVATKGYYYNNGLKMGWNAETDEIGLFYKNLTAKRTNEAVVTPPIWNNWETSNYGTALAAAYKATTTGSRGFFTATSSTDILSWTKDAQGKIVAGEIAAYYPIGATVGSVTADPGAGFEVVMPNIATQVMADIKGTNAARYEFMTARAENILPTEEHNSVGETILGGEAKLTFQSHMVVLKLQMKNVKPEFGALKSITITATGDKDGNNDSKIAYEDDEGKWKFAGVKTKVGDKDVYDDKMNTDLDSKGVSAITLNMVDGTPTGFVWSDEDAYAYITTLPVTRTGTFTAETPETVTILYTFANTNYTATIKTANDWNAGESIAVPVMDFDKIPVYVVTPSGGSDSYLYINEGLGANKLSSLFNVSGKVEIGGVEYIVDNIKGLHSTSTKLDLDGLEKFTALTDLSIANPTITKAQVAGSKATLKNINLGANVKSIPTGFFANMAELLSLKGAGVTTIAEDAFAEGTTYKIANVILPAYKFDSKAVREKMLVKSSLATLDLSGVSYIGSTFGNSNLSLADYTALEEVVLNPNGVQIGLSAFDGCTSLATIENLDKIQVPAGADAIGANAFKGTDITKITVPGTRVPAGAFEGCAELATVKFAGVVTEIENSAFKSCAKLKGVDLSNVTEIGESAFEAAGTDSGIKNFEVNLDDVTILGKNAFKGCKRLFGDANSTLTVKKVEYISEGAFEGIKANYIVLQAATKLGLNSLNADFSQIKIDSVFDVDVNSNTPPVGVAAFKTNVTDVVLYVNAAQTGVNAKALTLHGTKYEFKSIVK